jgi:hypothetical protein
MCHHEKSDPQNEARQQDRRLSPVPGLRCRTAGTCWTYRRASCDNALLRFPRQRKLSVATLGIPQRSCRHGDSPSSSGCGRWDMTDRGPSTKLYVRLLCRSVENHRSSSRRLGGSRPTCPRLSTNAYYGTTSRWCCCRYDVCQPFLLASSLLLPVELRDLGATYRSIGGAASLRRGDVSLVRRRTTGARVVTVAGRVPGKS